MSSFIETACRTFTSGTTLGQYLRVKLSAGTVVVAGATDIDLGTTENPALVSGDPVSVRLRTAQGTKKMVASGVITAGNPCYAAADGKVASSGTVFCGTVLETTTADGDILEVLPGPNTDLSATLATTNAAAFEVDVDATTPRLAISGQSGGTGDFTTTLKPETTLSADNAIIVPEANGDTLVAVALTQTLTNKTLTSPVLTTPQINNLAATFQYVITPTAIAADRAATLPLLTGDDVFVFADFIQTLTNKTLTSPVLTTPQINDTSADHQYVFAVSELAADRIVTLPLLTGGDTFVFQAHTQALSNKSVSDALLFTAGTSAAAVVLRFGKTATEGLEVKVIDEVVTVTNAVETNLTQTVPSGAVILSVQANLDSTVAGDGSGDNGLTKIGIGTTADPDKYGLSADLVKNTKIDTIFATWTVLSGAETVCVKAADNAGAAVTEKFVAGGLVRVRIVYLACNSLDSTV